MASQAVAETRPQPGAKKRSARQRIQAEMATTKKPAGSTRRAANARTALAVGAVVKTDAMTGHRVNDHGKAAQKSGVRIRLWMKGSKTDPDKAVAHWLVLLPGRGDTRVITPDFDTEAAAKKAALAAGFKVVEA